MVNARQNTIPGITSFDAAVFFLKRYASFVGRKKTKNQHKINEQAAAAA